MAKENYAVWPPHRGLPLYISAYYQIRGEVDTPQCKSLSTIQGYHAAVKNYYEISGCFGPWDDETCKGNPCHSVDVLNYNIALARKLSREQTVTSSLPIFVGDIVLKSSTGVQQGDPLGPLLFSLVLNRLIKRIILQYPLLDVHTWYLDDGTFIGDIIDLEGVLELISQHGPELGLYVNEEKCELFWPKMKLTGVLFLPV